jgi:hypothetical protein
MPGAASASGLVVNVSEETCGQARSKAGAVAGDRSRVIGISDEYDRRMGASFRVIPGDNSEIAIYTHCACLARYVATFSPFLGRRMAL